MQTLIQEDKLKPPSYENLLPRPRLIKLARADDHTRLVLISAAPGFGKTALMTQIHRNFPGLRIWYRFDVEDLQPRRFVSNLRDCFRKYYPALESSVAEDDLNVADIHDVKKDLVMLLNELSEKTSRPAAVFLDDFQILENVPAMKEASQFFVRHLPDFFKIHIASRLSPDLSLGRLRLERKLKEIGSEDLQFDACEIREFLSGPFRHPLTMKEIEAWQHQTKGWPIVLGLSKPLIDITQRTPGYLLTLVQKNGGPLSNFITEEIWDLLDPDSKVLLQECSLVEHIEPDICTSVTTESSSARILGKLLMSGNLPVSANCMDSYELNPVFRLYLNKKLQQSHTREQIMELHYRYAQAFQKSGNSNKVIDHLLEAGMFDQAIDLIEDSAQDRVEAEQLNQIQKWLQRIPAAAATCHTLDVSRILRRVRKIQETAIGHSTQLNNSAIDPLAILTRREKQILALLAKGSSNFEIAEHFYICENTVKKHVSNIFQKLGMTKRSQAAAYLGE